MGFLDRDRPSFLLLATGAYLNTVADMSLNVGLGGRQGEPSRLRSALADAPESRSADRILAEQFWRAPAAEPRLARVLSLPLAPTP
jgi:hypothetical protein